MDPETAQEPLVEPLVDARRAASPHGEVRLLPREERVLLRGALEAARLLVVTIDDLGPGARGRLGDRIDDAIETALRDRGGAPPGVATLCDADATLSDQLYRLRQIGKVGLALDVGSLLGLADARGALEPDDGATLRFFAETTRERPLVVLLDEGNQALRLYGAPRPLTEALPIRGGARAAPVTREAVPPPPPPVEVSPAPQATVTKPRPPAPRVYVSVARNDQETVALQRAVTVLEEVSRATPLAGLERAFVEGYAPLRAAMMEERTGVLPVPRDKVRALAAQYAQLFSRAYAEALPTFAVTGRHPRMVFELFDLAHRSARVHGARAVQVVLVDALRWDLGARLRARLGQALARHAVCVDEQPLWSVLPTTTAVQLDALVRGEDALRAPTRPERETSIVRGRSLDVLRRTRLGHRDLLKLDLLEGRLRDPGASESTRLDGLADELTPLLERFVQGTANRTLVVIAGDHGFSFGEGPGDLPDPRRETGPARQGGASPDEVFVPFQAWLVGGVH